MGFIKLKAKKERNRLAKICSKCNKMNKDTGKFCERCGAELPASVPAKEPKKSSGIRAWWNSQGKGIKIGSIVGICCLGLIIIGLIVAMTTPDQTTSTTSTTPSSSSSTPTSTSSSANIYNANGISFSYPSNWMVYTPDEVDPAEIVNLKTTAGEVSILTVYRESTSLSTDELKQVWYDVMSNSGNILSDNTITVDGVEAFQITSSYSSSGTSGEQQIVGFVKNGKKYILLFTSSDIDSIQSDIDTIVNSFKTT
mgnify:FL=1